MVSFCLFSGRRDQHMVARRGRSIAPFIAILVIISGAATGAFVRFKQNAAPEPVLQGGSDVAHHRLDRNSQPPLQATEVSMLDHRSIFPLGTDDIEDTIEAPSLAVSSSGITYLAWATKTGPQERTLMMSRSEDNGKSWATPWKVTQSPIHVAVSEMRGRRIERHLHLLPHLATYKERLYLSWVRGGKDRSEVALLLATSDDKGETFNAPLRVHQSDQARPTFTSLAVSSEGDVACAWLDNRNDVQQCYMAVKTNELDAFMPEMLVDPGQDSRGVCPCCPTATAFAPDRSVWVAYRGQVDGMRDVWTATWRPGDASPSAPLRANQPTWKFDGCPHDGPMLVPLQSKTAIAWMDAHQGMSRVFVNQLALNDASKWQHGIATEIAPRFSGTQEQPCLIVEKSMKASSPKFFAAWSATAIAPDHTGASVGLDEKSSHSHATNATSGASRAIHFATSIDGGKTFSPAVMIAPRENAFQSRVKLASGHHGEVFVAYFELSSEGKRLVVGRLKNTLPPSSDEPAIAGVTP